MRIRPSTVVILSGLLAGLAACGPGKKHPGGGSVPSPADRLLGGSATVFDVSSNAYRSPLPGLTDDEARRHLAGDALFEAKFVTAPAPVYAGLGPQFNNNECEGCHLRDGRGSPTFGEDGRGSELLIAVSAPDGEPLDPGGPVPVAGIGLQVQDHAVFGAEPNAAAELTWTEEEHTFGDGTPYSLRRPSVKVTLAGGAPLPAGTMTSVRQPSAVYGLGLLSAVPDDTIKALADEPDKVKGRVNMVWSREAQAVAVGRFGRKAAKASVKEQAAKALALDMGLTNDLFPNAGGAKSELGGSDLETLVFYLETLAVPARRDVDQAEVQHGEELFHDIGCSGCHVTELKTGPHPVAALANQTIHPYTDLLLHDMGDGLADGRPEFGAGGREWRTVALWGIGLAQTVQPGATYLHDGRARSLQEAILWHGGQAEGRRETFRNLPAADRQALLRFLQSL